MSDVVRPICWAILLRFLKGLGLRGVESFQSSQIRNDVPVNKNDLSSSFKLESLTEEVTLEFYRSFSLCLSTIQAFENAVDL